ncbi:MAG: KamA family radical SAM protein [Pseudonocardia sp.]
MTTGTTTGTATGAATTATTAGRAGDAYTYIRSPLVEPDWRRLPGWRDVTDAQWRDAQWQRVHCVRNVRQLADATGGLLVPEFLADLVDDQRETATMSMLLTPQIVNTMVPHLGGGDDPRDFTAAFYADPVRRYMLPVRTDRHPFWPSHPLAGRDSLHESAMWEVEGLTHRYPTKVLAELLSTCPQYCGHCTRMDLVGNSTPAVTKQRLTLRPRDRQDSILGYLRETPGVRDVVVSGGDVANVPWPRLEEFTGGLLEIDSVRDIRLASKALAGLPQHWLQPAVVDGLGRLSTTARRRGVHLALHTHVNHRGSVTPLVAEAARTALDAGVRDVRNQGVLMRGVNDSVAALLDLCFALQDDAGIVPYYFYMCDMVPFAEHWRVALWEAQHLQHAILGHLPGYATPRIVCDVPLVGKRWVHQVDRYDRHSGTSYWTKNYRTPLDAADADPTEEFTYHDPLHTLPFDGQRWWRDRTARDGER